MIINSQSPNRVTSNGFSINAFLNSLKYIFTVLFILMDSIALWVLMKNGWGIVVFIFGFILSAVLAFEYWRTNVK